MKVMMILSWINNNNTIFAVGCWWKAMNFRKVRSIISIILRPSILFITNSISIATSKCLLLIFKNWCAISNIRKCKGKIVLRTWIRCTRLIEWEVISVSLKVKRNKEAVNRRCKVCWELIKLREWILLSHVEVLFLIRNVCNIDDSSWKHFKSRYSRAEVECCIVEKLEW